MSYQNISYVMPQADIDAVKAAIATINTKMPFLVNLDSDDVRSLFKLGPKSADFLQGAVSAASAFPQILPSTFNQAEFTKDAALFKALSEIKLQIDSISEKIDNTLVAVGSEAMTASLEVYTYVQTASDRTPGLKSVADKLKERFKLGGARKPKPNKGTV